MDQILGQVLGQHKIIAWIGGGGMGQVYEAVHVGLDQRRAIKILAPNLMDDSTNVILFGREARVAAGLRHPNIVQIYDVGSDRGLHYIAMELLDGKSLNHILAASGPLPLPRLVGLVEQLAAALDYAHERGVIHRDIKPSNVVIDANDHLTLVDFGIARAAESTGMTQTRTSGTPYYMAPEVWRGGGGSKESDLYALGVLVYELAVGHLPFNGPSAAAIMHGHIYESPPPPRKDRAELPVAIENALFKMLSKQPERRYASASEFVADLRKAASIQERLDQAQAAMDQGDLDRAEQLLRSAAYDAPTEPRIETTRRDLHLRHLQFVRAGVTQLLDVGDWRGAQQRLAASPVSADPSLGDLTQRIDWVRTRQHAFVPGPPGPPVPPGPPTPPRPIRGDGLFSNMSTKDMLLLAMGAVTLFAILLAAWLYAQRDPTPTPKPTPPPGTVGPASPSPSPGPGGGAAGAAASPSPSPSPSPAASRPPSPSPSPAPPTSTPTPSAPPTPAPGAVLFQDNFDDAARGILERSSARPDDYRAGYTGGEYFLQDLGALNNAGFDTNLLALPGTHSNVTIAVDAHAIGDATGISIRIGCRLQDNSPGISNLNGAYELSIEPASGRFWVIPWREGAAASERGFPAGVESQAIKRGTQWNHLELTCAGDTITASINGVRVFSQRDDLWRSGRVTLGASAVVRPSSEVRFDNLVVTQR